MSRLPDVPGLPQDADGPVFREPWEAQAFAMAVRLHEGGIFTWPEWAAVLAAEIAAARERGDPDSGDTYYLHWLAALERIVAEKQIATRDALGHRKRAWENAAARTPHGSPIERRPEDEPSD